MTINRTNQKQRVVRFVIVTLVLITALFAVGGQTLAFAQTPPGRMIVNPGFEQPDIPRRYRLIHESAVPGWQTTASDNLIEFWESGFLGVPSHSGSQHAELNATQSSILFQELCVVTGDTLNWSLAHRGRQGDDTMRLTIGGVSQGNFTTGRFAWEEYSGSYVHTAPTGIIKFEFESLGRGSNGNFLDSIEIAGLDPFVEFSSAAYGDDEANGGDLPQLLINGYVASDATVDVAVTGGSAVVGEDYTHHVLVTVPAGNYDGTLATAVPISLTIIDEMLIENDETIAFEITGTTGSLRIDDMNCGGEVQATATYTIINDEAPPTGCNLTSDFNVIHGTDRNDRLKGTRGDDLIFGHQGDDRIEGLEGNDCLVGGDGNDTIYGGDDHDTIWGGDVDNAISYSRDNDKLYGGDGDDEMHGGDRDDRLQGDDGNDMMWGDGRRDKLYGNDGDDMMWGGDDRDTLDGNDGNDEMHGGEGDDYLNGADGNDDLYGDGDRDKMYGGDGDDYMEGGDGDDTMSGSRGYDEMWGGEGRDRVDGGHEDDMLYGEEGDDKLYAGRGDDMLDGGADNDYLDGSSGEDFCTTGENLRSCEL